MAMFKLISLCLISMLILAPNPSDAVIPNDGARNQIRGPKLPASDASSRTVKKRVDPKRNCREMGSRSECGENPKCRWCRSDALDDMCFSKSEAGRLPSQVFSCKID